MIYVEVHNYSSYKRECSKKNGKLSSSPAKYTINKWRQEEEAMECAYRML